MERDGYGARILLALSEHKAGMTVAELQIAMQDGARHRPAPRLGRSDHPDPVYEHLEKLLDLKLIEVLEHGRYGPSSGWRKIQDALRLSLPSMADLGSTSFVCHPEHGPPEKLADAPDIFVLMPFSDKFEAVYQDIICPVAHELGYRIERADDIANSKTVITNVWNYICNCRVVIADCTGRNPNVSYEAGLADAVGKPVILITQKKSDVPFDLAHRHYLHYALTLGGTKKFKIKLADALRKNLRQESGVPPRHHGSPSGVYDSGSKQQQG